MSAAVANVMEAVPESQRLIAVSLGKIAASRGQKGGINLHKNLLVATVLHKARTVYMMQHYNRQRAAAAAAVAAQQQQQEEEEKVSQSSVTSTTNVEMKDETASSTSSSSSASPMESSDNKSAEPAPLTGPLASTSAPTSQPAFPGGAEVVNSRCEDKENSPPSSSSASSIDASVTVPTPVSAECEARLHDDKTTSSTHTDSHTGPSRLSHHAGPVTHSQNSGTRTYVRSSCNSCVLKRRRLMDNENVCAPKVRILESKVGADNTSPAPEAMQCDSPQISSLVNIFNTSFANGLAGNSATQTPAGGEVSVRTMVVSSHSHKLSENLTCAKEISMGGCLDSPMRQQHLVLSV